MPVAQNMEDEVASGLAANSHLAKFVCDANDALRFRLVHKHSLEQDLRIDAKDEDKDFAPGMCHQIYGNSENIFGYLDLDVCLAMTAGSLKAYLHVSSSETADAEGVPADPVAPPIVKLLAPGQLAASLEEFRAAAAKEEAKFRPLGDKVFEWSQKCDEEQSGPDRRFEVYKCDNTVEGFVEYHARLQPWIMFYIDAASYIDIDDKSWTAFLLFEKVEVAGETSYSIVGYVTVYQYYAYPDKTRPRISQMLILPPFQGHGLGAKLLNTVQKHFWNNDAIVDITVEDPSEPFVRLRDFVDCRNCLDLPSFAPDKLKQGFSDAMAQESNDKFKLCKRQARRVYEILRLKATNQQDDAEFKAYRVDVKKRLNQPFLREERDLSKLKKALKPEEFAASTVNVLNTEKRLEALEEQYKELEGHFNQVIDRLAD